MQFGMTAFSHLALSSQSQPVAFHESTIGKQLGEDGAGLSLAISMRTIYKEGQGLQQDSLLHLTLALLSS